MSEAFLKAQQVKKPSAIRDTQETQETWILFPGSGRSPGGGHDNPLQYPCLENPMDRGAWWATVYGVPKSWKRLNLLQGFPGGTSGKEPSCQCTVCPSTTTQASSELLSVFRHWRINCHMLGRVCKPWGSCPAVEARLELRSEFWLWLHGDAPWAQ